MLDQLIPLRAEYPMMSLTAFILLLHIARNGPVHKYRDCADQLQFPSCSSIGVSVDCLEKWGLITRSRNPKHANLRVLAITQKGQELVECLR